jgi:hypothetical protein
MTAFTGKAVSPVHHIAVHNESCANPSASQQNDSHARSFVALVPLSGCVLQILVNCQGVGVVIDDNAEIFVGELMLQPVLQLTCERHVMPWIVSGVKIGCELDNSVARGDATRNANSHPNYILLSAQSVKLMHNIDDSLDNILPE